MGMHVLIFRGGDVCKSQEVDIQSGDVLLEDKIVQKILPEDAEKIQDKKRRGQKSAKDPQQTTASGYDPIADLEDILKRR